jgi:hypothetical protein
MGERQTSHSPYLIKGWAEMDGFGHGEFSRGERVKRGLMVWCALILFVLGVWLLVEPLKARGAEKVDNVVANTSHTTVAPI